MLSRLEQTPDGVPVLQGGAGRCNPRDPDLDIGVIAERECFASICVCTFAVGQLNHGLQYIHVRRLAVDSDIWKGVDDRPEVFVDGTTQRTCITRGIVVGTSHSCVYAGKVEKLCPISQVAWQVKDRRIDDRQA